MSQRHTIVIAGGGTGGLAVAARLLNANPQLDVAIIEPSEHHYYQPLWTLVGGGVFSGKTHEAPGGRLRPPRVPAGSEGLHRRLRAGRPAPSCCAPASASSTSSSSSPSGCSSTGTRSRASKGTWARTGSAPTTPTRPSRAPGSSSRISPVETRFSPSPRRRSSAPGRRRRSCTWPTTGCGRRGVREKTRVIYASATPAIFGVKHYRRGARAGRPAQGHRDPLPPRSRRGPRRGEGGRVPGISTRTTELVLPYDLLHVVPPQSAPDVVKTSALANKRRLGRRRQVHAPARPRYPNVFALGDNSSLPTSRTGAAIRKQAPVFVGEPPRARDG
jgi:sulfide:quinone oxidoreductase